MDTGDSGANPGSRSFDRNYYGNIHTTHINA